MASLAERVQRACGDRYRLEAVPPGFPAAAPPWELLFATDTVLHWPVVIKTMSLEGLDPVLGLRFEKEVGSIESAPGWLGARAFAHPRLHPILARSGSGAVLYYVTRWRPEGSLRLRLRREPRLPLAEAVRILDDVADALEFLHSRHCCHHRVKPENILFDQGRAGLADFASRIVPRGKDDAWGTVHMSPEEARGGVGDARADVYGLASVGYEMLAGRFPFEGALFESLLAKLTGPAPLLASPGVPEALASALSKAMAPLPEDRFADVASFRAALRAAAPP